MIHARSNLLVSFAPTKVTKKKPWRTLSADHALDLDLVVSAHSHDGGEQIDQERIVGVVRMIISSFSTRDRDIMFRQYGIIDRDVLTLRELGVLFGVSQSRISQLKMMALNRIRSHLLLCGLMDAEDTGL
jgi:DNA-directed RNA polymerase sigma subunit (sigma70/sigma32)